MNAAFRANPGLIVGVALGLGVPLVLILVGLIMRGAGASLRPIVFLAAGLLPFTWVFLLGQFARARLPSAEEGSTLTLAVKEGRFADGEKLFGRALSPEQFRDAKAVFPEFFGEAEQAELGIVGVGETVLVAQFPSVDAAKRAAASLWRAFQITNTSGDEERGWRGQRRSHSDYIEMLRTGRHLFFWTGMTKQAAAAHRAASQLPVLVPQPLPAPLVPALQPLRLLFQPVGMRVFGLILAVALGAWWFFKGAGWASSVPAQAEVRPVSARELAERLESINALDVPFRVERGVRTDEYFATWRFADAKWVDLARAHGLRRIFRVRLLLDEDDHTVRATDYYAGADGSAGLGGARVEWQARSGLVFFQSEQRRVFGLQRDDQGRFKPELSYGYRFNVDEVKSPLIDATIRAGWTWRPTVWSGPRWLRWLTE